MLIVLAFVIPCICGQIFTPTKPLLTAGRGAKGLVLASVATQLLANWLPEFSPVLVPASFAGGTAALVMVVWSSAHRVLPALLAGSGAVGNLIPIAWYGAMPVRQASRASFAETALSEPSFIAAKHTEMAMSFSWNNPTSLLIDWIPVPLINGIVSIGDILLVVAFIALGIVRLRDAQATPYAAKRATEGSSAMALRWAA